MALISKLENIGNAIRNRTGKTDKLTLDQMVSEIDGIKGGSENQPLDVTSNGTYTAPEGVGYSPVVVNVPQDGGLTPEELTITGNCDYKFANGGWDWFIKKYGNQITTKDITDASHMFNGCGAEIPFELNAMNGRLMIITGIFFNYGGTKIPKISKCQPRDFDSAFKLCSNIRYYPEDIENYFDWSWIDASGNSPYSNQQTEMLWGNYSLRKLPYGLLKHGNPSVSNSGTPYHFYQCCALDEIVDLPNPYYNAEWKSNAFGSYNPTYGFVNCGRLARLTFAPTMTNGQPNSPKWSNQMIDLSSRVGYINGKASILNYNSGITADKEVKDDASYQALKNDPDWFTTNEDYSRYNHTSAVETINSLPDTSAYLATAGGTNTIKFEGRCGSKTDGGAISALTPEEIAVAAARGWTVTLV